VDPADCTDGRGQVAPCAHERREKSPIRRLPQEELPGIQPLLFRELDHRIAQTRLEHEPLPTSFLRCDSDDAEDLLVFRGEQYDLNLTLFAPQPELRNPGRGSGVFVVSNGAGVASNTVDQLSRSVCVAGMLDLKRSFAAAKIAAAFEMIRSLRPDLDVLAINVISGIALAGDTVEAVERFCASVEDATPVVIRFSGPHAHENRDILRGLEHRHRNVTVARSTRDLIQKTTTQFGVLAASTASVSRLAEQVEAALEIRALLGVTMRPQPWLTPDRTIEKVFGTKADTRIGVLGFGKTARFQLRTMIEAGLRIGWVVTPSAARHTEPAFPGVEIFPSVRAAVEARGDVDVVLNYAPAAHALAATQDCLAGDSGATLMILVAENMPYQKAIRAMDALDESGMACIGPNSPGVMIVDEVDGRPDLFKLGSMPAQLFSIPGAMSVVGRSGTVIFDIVEKAATFGIGTRLAWAIGGDRYTGLGFLEALVILEQDPGTRYIVLHGEAGGIQEQLAARLLATGIVTKPVIALVTGSSLPAGVQCGHQGAVKFTEADDPHVKELHLVEAGAIVVSNPTEIVAAIQHIDRSGWDLDVRRRQALWEQFIRAGRLTGYRWPESLRPAYDALYDLVGHYRMFDAHERNPDHLHDLVTQLGALGVDRFGRLLSTLIRPEAIVSAFEKSREYVARLVRGICEAGVDHFAILVREVFSEAAFNSALSVTPWAASDLINEAHEVGISETRTTISKTVGLRLFRETLAARPWNTAHAFRSINNMRWWRYVRAYDRYCTHLTGDSQLAKASWRRNPWASVKLVRGYDRMPEGELERALDDSDNRALFFEKSRTDPQGLLDLGKTSFLIGRESGRPFHQVYSEQVRQGVPDPPEIDTEIARMGEDDFQALRDTLFTAEGFETARRAHEKSTARALRVINELGDGRRSGAQRLLETYRSHLDTFDTPSFHLAVSRNLWMLVDLLRATSRLDAVAVDRIVDYVVSQEAFSHAVAEHQWGTSQAFHKIADMGAIRFLDTHRILEDVTHDRECFGASFRKNPRDAVEIVQVVANIGEAAFGRLMSDSETREAFLARMRLCPRNAAHVLQEIALMGVEIFNELADLDLGRPLVNELLRSRACHLVRILRRINIVGIDDARHGLRGWRSEDPRNRLTPDNALAVIGAVKERVLQRRLACSDRRIAVTLPGQPVYQVSEGEIRGLYQSYPEWGDVLFKLHGGDALTQAERVDLYRLVSGRKRFQSHMVSILANFVPLQTLRARILEGEPLIRELQSLRGVTQGPGHRFDAYLHTLEVLDQLVNNVLPLEFAPEPIRRYVHEQLDGHVGPVSRRDLLLLASALHDLGKVSGGFDEPSSHAQRSVAAAQPILERFGLNRAQQQLVLDVIAYHVPAKLRKPGEPWDDFVERGGLDGLYDELTGSGQNGHPIESILLYHADILGRRGDETPHAQIRRRQDVTCYLLERHMRAHGEPAALQGEQTAL